MRQLVLRDLVNATIGFGHSVWWTQGRRDILQATRETPRTKMKPSQALSENRAAIRNIVESHCALNARVFGSVAKGTDTEESDLDILVDTTPDATLFDIGAIRYELRNLLGVRVDVLTPGALPESLRACVISEAVPV